MGREDACLWSRPWLRYLAMLVLGAKSQLPEGEALVLPPPGDRQTASPPARQPSPAQHQQRWAPAQTDNRGRSRSRSRSQTSDNTHRHTQTRTWTIRSQHTVAVRLPLGPLVRIIRLIASHEWSCAERAAHPGQTKPGHDPGPARLRRCVAALLLRRGRTCFDSSERERVPIHVPCPMSLVPCPTSPRPMSVGV
jgi:hypothetical protein